MLKIHVTLHLMLEVRNKDYVYCITYSRIYTYVGVLCINLRFYQFTYVRLLIIFQNEYYVRM